MNRDDNPVRKGSFIWRGLWNRRPIGIVENIFGVVEVDGELLVSLQYTHGEYGIVRIYEKMKPNGLIAIRVAEVAINGEDAAEALWASTSPPEIIQATGDAILIGVTAGDIELVIRIFWDAVKKRGSWAQLTVAP